MTIANVFRISETYKNFKQRRVSLLYKGKIDIVPKGGDIYLWKIHKLGWRVLITSWGWLVF